MGNTSIKVKVSRTSRWYKSLSNANLLRGRNLNIELLDPEKEQEVVENLCLLYILGNINIHTIIIK